MSSREPKVTDALESNQYDCPTESHKLATELKIWNAVFEGVLTRVINRINQKTLKSSKVGRNADEIENLAQGLP